MVVNNVHVQYFHKIKNNEVLLLDKNTKFKAPFWDTKEAILRNSCGMVGCMQVIFSIGVSISKLSISTSDESLLFFTLTPVFDIFAMIFKFLKTSFWVREINHAVNLTSSQNFFIEMMVKRGYTLDQNEFHVTCGPSLLPQKAFQFLQLGLCILEFRTQAWALIGRSEGWWWQGFHKRQIKGQSRAQNSGNISSCTVLQSPYWCSWQHFDGAGQEPTLQQFETGNCRRHQWPNHLFLTTHECLLEANGAHHFSFS